MMTRSAIVLAMAAAVLLAAPPVSGDEPGARIITVADEGAAVPGLSSVKAYDGPLPETGAGGRAISQMPGWPRTMGLATNFNPSRGLVFADLDGDNRLEIITSSTDKKLYAWDYTGADMPGFPVLLNNMAQYAPSVADLDGDGDMEIVQLTRGMTSGGRLYIIDHLGAPLPGFPVSVNNNNLASCPTLHDLDNDGDMEIIVGERSYPVGYLRVFEVDGSEWGGNWPVLLDHVPTGTASVGDVDADGEPEIFYMSYDSMYLMENDGTIMPGWPKQIANANFSYQSAAMADLDGDGDLEIAVGAHKDAAGCYIFHHDGTPFPGWPRLVGTWTYCPPTITDLEGDGQLEILDGRAGYGPGVYSDCFWAWDTSGSVKPGFPYSLATGGGCEGPLTVVDIDGDGKMEIFADYNIMSDDLGFLFGVDSQGNDLPGFPLRPEGFTYMNGAAIGDVDGDGDIELGVISSYADAQVNLYDLPETYHPAAVSWENYHKKNARGGLRGSEDRLHIQGHFAIASTIRMILHDEPGGKASLRVSRGIKRKYFSAFGWFYLDFAKMINFNVTNVTIPSSGEVIVTRTIPNNPALVGKTFYFQGLTKNATGQGSMTNLLGRTVH